MDLSIVIPAYNESARIGRMLSELEREVDDPARRTEIVFVDDASNDGTIGLLKDFAATRPSVHIIENVRNLGKGGSVKRGMLAATGTLMFFMDADLSVPLSELSGAIEAMKTGGHAILIGSRKVAGARIVRRQPAAREFSGQVFTYLTRALLCRDIVDFTCGFKGFTRDAARRLFARQRREDWAFDAEILYIAKLLGIAVYQHPVRWEHHADSRVRFPQDAWQSLVGLVDIRLRTPRLTDAR